MASAGTKYINLYTFDILKPFKYSNKKIFAIWSLMLALSFILPLLIGLVIFKAPTFLLILWIFLLISSNIIAVKILLKTEIVGQIRIDRDFVHIKEKQIPFESIQSIKLSPYVSRSRQWYIPDWKRCSKLDFILKDHSSYSFLISEKYRPLTIPIDDLLEDFKQTNKEFFKKIEVPNRTGYFLPKA